MAEYSVGVATRSKIYKAAKALFYQQGVHETSYAHICAAAEVNKGLIPYYFKSKMNIACMVYRDFIAAIDNALVERWGEGSLSAPERNIIFELLMFRLLRANKNVLRFYSQVMSDPECHATTLASQEEVMNELAQGSHVSVDESELRSIICMVNGTEGELVMALCDGYLTESTEDFVRRDILACYFLLGSNIDLARQWCDEGFTKAEGLELSCNEDFEIHVVESAA